MSYGLKIIRYPDTIGRYYMLLHSKDIPSKQRLVLTLSVILFYLSLLLISLSLGFRFKLLGSAKERFKTDGLNSLEYTVVKKEYRRLYTWALVSFKENVQPLFCVCVFVGLILLSFFFYLLLLDFFKNFVLQFIQKCNLKPYKYMYIK